MKSAKITMKANLALQKDDTEYETSQHDLENSILPVSQRIIEEIDSGIDFSCDIKKLLRLTYENDISKLNFATIPIIPKLMEVLSKMNENGIISEEISIVHDIFVFFQLMIQNNEVSELFKENEYINFIISLLCTDYGIILDISKFLSIFVSKNLKNLVFAIENQIFDTLFRFLISNYTNVNCPIASIFNFFSVVLKMEIGDEFFTDFSKQIIELHSLIIKNCEHELSKIQDTLNSVVVCESIIISKSVSFLEFLLESEVLQKLNSLLSDPSFAGTWRSIIKLNVNILFNIDKESEFWEAAVSSIDANSLYVIFVQQPFEEYSQEALKLLNNLIVDIPELSSSIPNDFIDIFKQCIDEFSFSQKQNSLRLCFTVIYQGNEEFTDLFIDKMLLTVPDIMVTSKELQDYFAISFTEVLKRKEKNLSQKQELANAIDEMFRNQLSDCVDNASQPLIEFLDYINECID